MQSSLCVPKRRRRRRWPRPDGWSMTKDATLSGSGNWSPAELVLSCPEVGQKQYAKSGQLATCQLMKQSIGRSIICRPSTVCQRLCHRHTLSVSTASCLCVPKTNPGFLFLFVFFTNPGVPMPTALSPQNIKHCHTLSVSTVLCWCVPKTNCCDT
jgi:hypothetical protein